MTMSTWCVGPHQECPVVCEELERLDANGFQVRVRGRGLHFTSQVSLAAGSQAVSATDVKRLAAPLHHHFLEHPDEVEWMLAQRPA